MAINPRTSFSFGHIPWRWVTIGLTVLGCGYMGWQIWTNALDRPISEDSIRKQQLRLSTGDLQQLEQQLNTYHQAPAATDVLTTDPLGTVKSSTTSP